MVIDLQEVYPEKDQRKFEFNPSFWDTFLNLLGFFKKKKSQNPRKFSRTYKKKIQPPSKNFWIRPTLWVGTSDEVVLT